MRCGGDPATPSPVYKSFLLVSNNGAGANVHSHALDATTGSIGARGADHATSGDVGNIDVTPDGKFAYAWDQGDGIRTYSIATATGELTEIGTPTGPSGPGPVRVSPDGKFLFNTQQGAGGVLPYAIDASTGALTAGTAVNTSGFATFGAFHPTLKVFYQPIYSANGVQLFTYDGTTGAVTASGLPVASGPGPNQIAVAPNGKWAYTANYNGTSITAFTINGTTGVLTPGAATSVSANPGFIDVSPDSKFVAMIPTNSPPKFYVFTTNATTGALTAVAGSPFDTGGTASSNASGGRFDPSSGLLYIAQYDGTGSAVSVFKLGADGTPTAITGSPFDICYGINALAFARLLQP